MNELIYDAGIPRMDYAFELQETIEGLFLQGADEEHSEQAMLEKLASLNWSLMLHPIMDGAITLYEYTVALKNAGDAYRGRPLTEEKAIRLYVDYAPPSPASGYTTFQRSMELWLLTDMTLLVTSCFRVTSDPTVSEYRTIKGCGVFVSDFAIDFDEIAMYLKSLCNTAQEGGVPFYEL